MGRTSLKRKVDRHDDKHDDKRRRPILTPSALLRLGWKVSSDSTTTHDDGRQQHDGDKGRTTTRGAWYALRCNRIQSIVINSRTVFYRRSAPVGWSASFSVGLSVGRRRQCMKRAIIKHLFSGVLALRSTQFWRCAGADLRRSDQG